MLCRKTGSRTGCTAGRKTRVRHEQHCVGKRTEARSRLKIIGRDSLHHLPLRQSAVLAEGVTSIMLHLQ